MKKQLGLLFGVCALLLTGCKNKNNEQVISQNYVHKYGYSLTKKEWETNKYPGQVITSLKDGKTITATYEDGMLHGPYTTTFPHSQTIASYTLYNQGTVIKEIAYDQKGIPQAEKIHLSPVRHSITLWYEDGTPRSIEEYNNGDLLEGQYFTRENETESRVIKGYGERMVRDKEGTLLAKEQIEKGHPSLQETFYPNGSPRSLTALIDSQIEGERKEFDEKGEPLALEIWKSGLLHGVATYYKNGNKYREVPYEEGKREGKELYFVDGALISQDVIWINDKKHGPSNYYVNGTKHTEWYYEGRKVSHREFRELDRIDRLAAQSIMHQYVEDDDL